MHFEVIVNSSGSPENLRPRQFGNANAVTHGVYSRKVLAPEARAIADLLMAVPYTIEIDRLGAEEIGALEALIQRVDAVLLEQELVGRRGKPHPLLELRVRISRQLERLLKEYFATPLSRSLWAGQLGERETFTEIVRDELHEGARLVQAVLERGDFSLPQPSEPS